MNEIVIFEDPEKGVGFAQMCHLLTCDNTISHGAYRTYAALLIFAMQSSQCDASVERVAAILDCSRQMLSDYLKELQGRGLIRRERQEFGKTMVTTILNLNQVYQDDPILNRFIELSGRFNGQLGFTNGNNTVVKQALPQSSSELDDSSKEDLTTDVKQALPEEEEINNPKKEKKKAAHAATPPGAVPAKKQPKDYLQHVAEIAAQHQVQGDQTAIADASVPGDEFQRLVVLFSQKGLGREPPNGKKATSWKRAFREIVKSVGEEYGLEQPLTHVHEALEALIKDEDHAWSWKKSWRSPFSDSFKETLSNRVGRTLIEIAQPGVGGPSQPVTVPAWATNGGG